MNIPIPDSGVPVQLGDDHFVYKDVYHPIIWINELPYRPRVETLVILDGSRVWLRIKDGERGSSGNKGEYELPGGSTDTDSTMIKQAENEVNEEALISIKNIYDTGIQYYEDYPEGFIMHGGDTPLEYKGHISNVFVAEYSGIYDKKKVEEKDLDLKISSNGKFYNIIEVAPILRKEHKLALLNSPYVSSAIKGSLRLLEQRLENEGVKSGSDCNNIPGCWYMISTRAGLTSITGVKNYGTKMHVESSTTKVRVFPTIDDAITGYDSQLVQISNGSIVYVYRIVDDDVCLYNPKNDESPTGKLTGEMWIKGGSPISIHEVGKILVTLKGETDNYYFGRNCQFKGVLTKYSHKWISKTIHTTNVMEGDVNLEDGCKLYHGSTYEITEFRPMSLDLGNANEEPGWSTFTFADYTLALRFGLMRAIQKVKSYYEDEFKSVVCSWDLLERKPWITSGDFNRIHDAIVGFKFYVYTINPENLNIGLGNDDRLPEYTFRESGVIPEKTDVFRIDDTLLKEHLLVVPTTDISKRIHDQEMISNKSHIRGWYSVMMTKDYNNGEASGLLQKAVDSGDLKPGDDIQTYMDTHGISFSNDTISMTEYGDVVESANYSKENKYPVFIILMHTGTTLANAIKTVTKNEFTHACISFTKSLNPFYSFGTKKLGVKEFGLTIQSPSDEFYKKYKTHYSIYAMYVDQKAYVDMQVKLMYFTNRKDTLKYDIFNLLSCWVGRPSDNTEKKYFCSRFVATILGAGTELQKAPSLYKPQDFVDFNNISLVDTGDDFGTYDYRVVEKNLNLIKRGKFDEMTVQEPISEATLFSSPDVYHNFTNFESGDSNIVFITGLPGSGKSSLGKEIAKKYKAQHIELDLVSPMDGGDVSESKCTSRLYDKFIKTTGSKVSKDSLFMYNFIKFVINWAETHKNEKFVVEGIQLADLEMGDELLMHPLIILGASAMKSAYNSVIRREHMSIKEIIKYAPEVFTYNRSFDKKHIYPLKKLVSNYENSQKNIPVEETTRSELPDEEFGLPELRKYPLDTTQHIKSAIKFFNYVKKENEKELAENILKKIDELGIKGEIFVTEKNRFYKYFENFLTGNTGVKESASTLPDKEGMQQLADSLSEEESKQFLAVIARYSKTGKDGLIYSNTAYISGNPVGIIGVYRDLDNETVGHAVILVNNRNLNSGDIAIQLYDSAKMDLLDIRYGIDSISIDYTNTEPSEDQPELTEQVDFESVRKEYNTIVEAYTPVMEAPNDKDETPTDYTEDLNIEGDNVDSEDEPPSDYTEEVDDADGDNQGDTENDNDDLTDETPTDYTENADEESNGDAGDPEDTTQGDSQSEPDSTTEKQTNGNLFDNNVLKNYSILRNFEKLYELTKEVSDSLSDIVMPTKLQNVVLTQVLKNLSSIKEFILSYVKFQFTLDNYSQNLYYYNVVLQALYLNLELLKRNKQLEEIKTKSKIKEVKHG